MTISVWNHKKVHKKQGAGFLGCVRIMSNAITQLKDTGCKYRKVPKFWDAKNPCCSLHKIQTKRPKLWAFYHYDVNGIANSEDPVQTAPRGAV